MEWYPDIFFPSFLQVILRYLQSFLKIQLYDYKNKIQ